MSDTFASTEARRPQLLVSVRDVSDAEAALAGGADWIDLKEPSAGPLGAVSVETAHAVVDFVAGRVPVSAALGELVDWADSPARGLLEVARISAVKLGLARCSTLDDWQRKWLVAEAETVSAGMSLVAVIYADWREVGAPSPGEVLQLAEQTSCRHMLVDTYDKLSAGTLDCLGMSKLRSILNNARRAGLMTVVAGKLKCAELSQLPVELIDVVAVRGGVCPQGRNGMIEAQLVSEFRQGLAAHALV